jgi:hypothetical protein
VGPAVLPLFLSLLLSQEGTVEQLIERLRSDVIGVREKASRDLLAKGVDVVAALEPLKADPDAELAARVQELLDLLAKKAFDRVEAAIYGVTTLRVRISGSGAICRGAATDRLTTSATILIGLIDKASHIGRSERKGEPVEAFDLVSDGFDMTGHLDPREEPKTAYTPSNLKEGILAMLFLVGEEPLRETERRWQLLRRPGDERPNPRRSCRVSGLSVRKENARCETLSFRVEGPEVPLGEASVRLTYDAATGALVKRVLTTVDEDLRPAEFVETFEEFAVNADIPEEKFRLPEEKK